MKDFADYLSSLPRTPVTEAVTALYEGLTKSDLALGRYLKSFNKGVKVPPIPQGMKPTEQAAYMMLARHPKEVAKLLDIGVTYGIPEDGEDEFDETFAEIDIQDTIKKISGVTSDRSRGAVRCATADIVYVYEHLDNKDELKKAADLYRNGQSDAGYTALKNALGVIDFDYFVNPIVKLLKSEDPYRDSKLFVMNPDIKNHLLRNHWLIHETSVEAGLSIIKTGFDRGNLAGDLAMTTWGKHYQTGDYLFAHDVMDMLSHEDYKSRSFGSYGNFALVFQGSGYKAYHDIDEENQVMFDYHEPKAFFVILHRDDAEEAGFPVKNTEYEDYKYAVYGQGKSGAPAIIFANESAYKCLEWIVQHGASYRNAMFKVSAPAVTEAVTAADGLRKPSAEELAEFVAIASETEHRMRGDWESNKDAIIAEDNEFIEQVSNGAYQAVTDGNGIVIYGPNDGRMYVYLLFVRPECRRTGTAQRLMEYVKSQAGGMPIALSVNNHNEAARALYKKLGMTDGKTFGYDGYDIIEMQSPLTESVEPMTFSTLEELRNYLDRAAYGTFENSEYDQYEQEPYGSLENIQEVAMEDFVKDMSGMNHDIQSLVGQPIDDKTLNQLVYDWFVCLHTRGAVGWQYNWN